MRVHGSYISDDEQLFIFRDRSPVMASHFRVLLKKLLKQLNINPDLYNCQSMRIGRGTDLLKFGFSVENIKRVGRWKSTAVYKYLRYF